MVSIEFQSQTSLLKPPELVQIYMLLDAGRRANRPFFAFYNCEHSILDCSISLRYHYFNKVVTTVAQVSRISMYSLYRFKETTVHQ